MTTMTPWLALLLGINPSPDTTTLPLTDALHKAAPELNIEVLDRAVASLECAKSDPKFNPKRFAVVDFSLPSTSPRMWIFDLQNQKLLLRQTVSHGRGSGGHGVPTSFSDVPGSNASSLGLYRVSESYKQVAQPSAKTVVADAGEDTQAADTGRPAYVDPYPRARIDGLWTGWNDTARERAVVIHSSNYTTPTRAGLSEGCFTIPQTFAVNTVSWLKDGGALYADAPNPQYLDAIKTRYANCDVVQEERWWAWFEKNQNWTPTQKEQVQSDWRDWRVTITPWPQLQQASLETMVSTESFYMGRMFQ